MAHTNAVKPHTDIKLIFNRHWYTLLSPTIIFGIGVMISYLLINIALSSMFIQLHNKNIIIVLAIITLTIHIHWYIITLLKWELSSCLITSKKVIIFQNTPFIKNDSTFIDIREIDEIEKKTHGLLKNLLNFGDIQIYLAASTNTITIQNVPNPDNIIHVINSQRG